MTNIEIWKDIPRYKGFQVSNTAKVKKLSHISKKRNGQPLFKPDKLLKTSINKKGYQRVELCLGGMKKKTFTVHRLIMYAFVGLPPTGMDQVNHKDGNKLNNDLDNLEWSNNSHNIAHAWRIGLFKPNLPNSIECARASILVHKEYGTFCTILEAAKECGFNRKTLSDMVRNKIKNKTKYLLT